MTHISDLVLKQIAQKKQTPWHHFFVWKVIKWLALIIFFILGVFSWALMWGLGHTIEALPLVQDSWSDIISIFHLDLFAIWFIAFVFASVLAIKLGKKIHHGYLLTPPKWFLIIVLPQIVLGYWLINSSLGERIDHFLGRNINAYESIFDRRANFWLRPTEGFLMGRIIEINETGFVLNAPTLGRWQVEFAPQTEKIEPNRTIKIRGEIISDGVFRAKQILFFTPSPILRPTEPPQR